MLPIPQKQELYRLAENLIQEGSSLSAPQKSEPKDQPRHTKQSSSYIHHLIFDNWGWFKKSRFWVTKGILGLSHFEVGKRLVVV